MKEKLKEISIAPGWVMLIGGVLCVVALHFIWILTDAEYSKHSQSAYALVELIKYGWWAMLMAIGGAFLAWWGD